METGAGRMPDAGASTSNAEAFEALVMPLLGMAYGVAYNLSGNRQDAEDLVQEAALQAFRAFDSFEEGTNFKAWFFRILTNAAYAKHRQRKRRPITVELDDVPELYLYAETEALGLHTRSEDPARLVLGKMSVEQVTRAIEALPEEYRAACALYFMDELTYEEIAEMLGCPVGTVRSRLHRGRRMLQKMLWTIAEEEGIVRELRDAEAKG